MNVSINASENGLLLFVLPTQPLVAGSRYVLTLTADITDTSGNALEAVSFEFTTVSAPAISAVTPTEGPVGTAVTILGQNFDAQAQMNVVKFGTTAALVLSATTTQLETVVPAGLAAGSVGVSVATRGGASTISFMVENPVPVLGTISPHSVRVGSSAFVLSLTGSGFTAASTVTFGSTILSPLSQTATRLDVQIPAALVNTLGTRNVLVHNPAPGGGSSLAIPFIVEGVVITGMTPASGPVGTLVRLSGAGFDPVLANNTVRFNGTSAGVTVASATVLETIVPAGAASGPITITTPAGEATSTSFTVTNGTRLLISRTPDQSTYSPGQSITIHTLLVDSQGQPVHAAAAALVSVPAEASRAGNTFVYHTNGTYTITATINTFGGPISASIPITIATDRAQIACAAPVDGVFLNQAPGPITFTGFVSVPTGVGTLTVNGTSVAVGTNGTFSTGINAARGMNFVDLVLTDIAGSAARRTCAFMLGEIWAAENQFLPDSVSFRAAQAAIDDGNRAGAVNSIGDVLALATSSTNLRNIVHATLQAENPLKPLSCDSFFLGLCVMTSRIRHVNTHTPGPNTASLQLTEGGILVRMRWENPAVALRVDGHVTAIPYDTIGLVAFDYIEDELVLDVTVDSSGRPKVSVRPGTLVTRRGSIHTTFNGLDGFILNLVGTFSDGLIAGEMTRIAGEYGTQTAGSVVGAMLAGLDVTTIAPVNEVVRLDSATPIFVRADRTVSSFQTNGLRVLAGIGLRFQTGAAHSRPSLGVSIPAGTVLRDPLSSGQPLADAIHVSVLGQSLHALWRAGFFDAALTEEALSGVVPSGATVRLATALPPSVVLRADNRVELALGGINMHVDHPGLLEQPLDSSLGAKVSCDRRLNGDALVLENCTVDDLHLSTIDPLSDSTATELRQLVSDVVRSIASTAAQRALPALPVPGFRIDNSLAVYGLTPGAVLGIVNPTLETSGNHLVLRGGFAIQ